jgi:hypothetical protein
MPIVWAVTKNNLGGVQTRLGERLAGSEGLQALGSAESNFQAALEILNRDTSPAYWRIASDNLITVKELIAERGG